MVGQALPLDAGRLEHFKRACQQADFVGAAEPRDGGFVFPVGDLPHRVHHGSQRPHDAVSNGKIGREANDRGNERNGNASHQEI